MWSLSIQRLTSPASGWIRRVSASGKSKSSVKDSPSLHTTAVALMSWPTQRAWSAMARSSARMASAWTGSYVTAGLLLVPTVLQPPLRLGLVVVACHQGLAPLVEVGVVGRLELVLLEAVHGPRLAVEDEPHGA